MKGLILAIGGLVFLAGCDTGDKPASVPPTPKVAKAPYQIDFDTKLPKPNPAGVALPDISYTADPKAELERRAVLVVRFDASAAKHDQTPRDQMIMGPVDLSGTSGKLPASYIDSADKGLAQMLQTACMKGTVKVKVALVRSSIKPDASDGEIDEKRLSDWLPTEAVFKNPHPKC